MDTVHPPPASETDVVVDMPAEAENNDDNAELSPEAAFHELCVAAADARPEHSVWATFCGFEEDAVEDAYQASLAESRYFTPSRSVRREI